MQAIVSPKWIILLANAMDQIQHHVGTANTEP